MTCFDTQAISGNVALLEASLPFKTGRSLKELIEAGLLHPGFRTLCSDALPLERPLYLHQSRV